MKYLRKYALESDWENDQQDRETNAPVTSWLVDVDEVRYDHEEDPATRLVLTSTSNPEAFTILDEAGFTHADANGYTAAELGEITDEDFYDSDLDSDGSTCYYSIFYRSDIETFDEFQYFTGITKLKHLAFSECANLSSIILPNSITEIFGRNNYEITINGHLVEASSPIDGTAITSLSIPPSVITIGNYAFEYCNSLTSITIPNSVTEIGSYAFNGCSNLTSVTIPNSVTTIGYRAFIGCGGLTSVTIGNSVTTIGFDAFSGCSGLTSVTIPNSVTEIGTGAFSSCSGLTSVTIPNSVTEIGNSTFRNCSGLTSVTIPNLVTSIGANAFSGCSGLTSVTIPNSVTEIGSYAFESCSGLSTLLIGNSVTSIGANALLKLTSLTSITSLATTAPVIQSSTFYRVRTGGTLHVPSGANYSTWMQNSNYYLGSYNWTIAYDA